MTNIEKGFCKCGCGRKTSIAPRNRAQLGWIKGEPLDYLVGHNNLAKRGPETAEGFKWCGTCEKVKPVADFANSAAQADGLQGHCRPCGTIKQAKWRTNNRAKANRASANSHRKSRIGIEPHEYDQLLEDQGGVCAICKEKCTTKTQKGVQKSLAADHDHVTGATRGLLCSKCNTAIGLLGDDPAVIAAALAYLSSHKPTEWITDAMYCHEGLLQ